MIWSIKKKAATNRRRPSSQSKTRGLRLEALENRQLLAGLVNLTFPPAVGGTQLVVTGDGDDNQITIQSTGAGMYLLRGTNGTLLSKDGGATTFTELPINGISGDITVSLGAGSDSFLVEPGQPFNVPASLIINDNGFGDRTDLTGATIPQNLIIQTDPAVGATPGVGAIHVLAGLSVNGTFALTNAQGANTTINAGSTFNNNVVITNHGANTNSLTGVTIGGDLWISKANNLGASGSTIIIVDSNVVGSTVITNISEQVPPAAPPIAPSGGTTSVTITNSQLQGRSLAAPAGLPAAVTVPAAPIGLSLTNGAGNDVLRVLGNTVIGQPIGVGIAPAVMPQVLLVNNGVGGSMITFGPVSAGGTSRVKVNGNATFNNGANVSLAVDMASFNQTDVLGAFALNNAGGPGATSTMITDSNLGTFLAPAGPGNGSPVIISNDTGEDAFLMSNSTAPWGLFINNDDAGGGNTAWGSTTTIQNSSIGMRLGGPAAAPAFPVSGNISLPGTGLGIYGGGGADVVKIEGAQMRVGGQVHLALSDGNNKVEILGNAASIPQFQSIVIATSNGALANGNDDITLRDIAIVTNLNISLGDGIDVVKLKGNTTLPANGVGTVVVDGGGGVLDKLEVDLTVNLSPALPPGVLPPGFINFEL